MLEDKHVGWKVSKSITVVKNCTVLAAATDAGVCHQPRTTVVGTEELEKRFQLILVHARSGTLHDLHVRIRADLAHIAQHFQLVIGLEDTQLADLVVQNVPVDREFVDTVEGGRLRVATRIRIQAVQRQQNIRLKLL